MKTTKRQRVLTHALHYAPDTGQWSCKCGYRLGIDGHSALYARCPLFARDKTRFTEEPEPEPVKPKPKPKLKPKVLELFDP